MARNRRANAPEAPADPVETNIDACRAKMEHSLRSPSLAKAFSAHSGLDADPPIKKDLEDFCHRIETSIKCFSSIPPQVAPDHTTTHLRNIIPQELYQEIQQVLQEFSASIQLIMQKIAAPQTGVTYLSDIKNSPGTLRHDLIGILLLLGKMRTLDRFLAQWIPEESITQREKTVSQRMRAGQRELGARLALQKEYLDTMDSLRKKREEAEAAEHALLVTSHAFNYLYNTLGQSALVLTMDYSMMPEKEQHWSILYVCARLLELSQQIENLNHFYSEAPPSPSS